MKAPAELWTVARSLGDILGEVVFVGGMIRERRYVQGSRGCAPGHPFAPHGIEDEKDTRTFNLTRGAHGGEPADRARGQSHFGSGRRAGSLHGAYRQLLGGFDEEA